MVKIAIIGGGPSGIFCAIQLLKLLKNPQITIFEKARPLATILPTGNGRCNLTYCEYDSKELASNYPRGEKFLYSIFARYGVFETLEDFKNIGIETYVQDDCRIFPKADSASFVKKKMLDMLKGVKFVNKLIDKKLEGYDATVLAAGLKSGADIAEYYGAKIVPLKSSLTGLKIKEKEFLKLKGVSFNGVIFTDCGVSGPYIYKLSSINAYKNFPYEIKIPLIDTKNLTDEAKLNGKKLFRTVVSKFIPKSLAEILIKTDKQCANVSKKEIEDLSFLKLTAINIDGRGEIVHAGGVSLLDVDNNLRLKTANNVWVIGELLDIDGFTGGFNLQNCWSTASIAAFDIALNFAP